METMNDFELSNMRQQMETLKKKLSAQEIVNDRLIRRSMRDTAGSISRRYWIPHSRRRAHGALWLLGFRHA